MDSASNTRTAASCSFNALKTRATFRFSIGPDPQPAPAWFAQQCKKRARRTLRNGSSQTPNTAFCKHFRCHTPNRDPASTKRTPATTPRHCALLLDASAGSPCAQLALDHD
jgi:hypothetical protein